MPASLNATTAFARRALFIAMAALIATSSPPINAATCPFDGGGSDAVNDGVVLTRYALGITGAPLVASTRYATLDPLQVKNNIECVGCALDMNGDGQIDAVDTTIIARHLAGFTGASLTAGLALGVAPTASRPTAAAITSFLATGCALGGAINAWTLGGNAFGAPSVIGTNDAQPLTVRSSGTEIAAVVAGGDGLRVTQFDAGVDGFAVNTISGSRTNTVSTALVRGATIAGGGSSVVAFRNIVTDLFGTVGGGYSNEAGNVGTVAGGYNNIARFVGVVGGGASNRAIGYVSSISGGFNNLANNDYAAIGGGDYNQATGQNSFVGGGRLNLATGTFSAVGGGGGNTASAHGSFIGGGGYCCYGVETTNYPNTVTGRGGSIVGGYENSVAGAASFIGGGYLNSITGTEFTTYAAAVLGGFNNVVSANYASVSGGEANNASAINTAIAGGAANSASAPYASVSGGLAAKARLYGQTANAAGSFSAAPGTAQATQYVLRNRTTDATLTYLYLNGSTETLVFEPGRAGLLDIQVVAFAEGTGFTASYAFKCHYYVVVSGAAIQPNGCNKAVVYEAEATWDANVSFAPGSNNAFGISVIGLAGRNIRWVATVRATEVSTL